MNIAASFLALVVFVAPAWSVEPAAERDSNTTALARAEVALRHAGASPAALAKFERQWRQLWPADARATEEYILGQPPAELARYIETLSQSSPDDQYTPGPDYLANPDAPRGKVFEFTLDHSRVFPGTKHQIRVYVPAQYTSREPASVHVQLDDLFFQSPTALDNLIYRHEVPPLIAIGVRPGIVDSSSPPKNPRFNRSVEFDGLSDALARFLLEEVFPEVERHKTPAGLPIRLSTDPNDRSVGGISTGGIGSFTLAWQRPDAFRRVFTGIGTFVGMRSGDAYPVLVRKTEPKPIRIFMQDGSHDELNEYLGEVGDWWLSNQTMLSALQFAGYSVEHVWGEGTHNGSHAKAVFPAAMRWLWRDWPKPVTAGESRNNLLKEILVAGGRWEALAPADTTAAKMFDGDRYRVVSPQGREYFTDRTAGKVWLRAPGGKDVLLDSGLKGPTGIAVTPDGLWLAVAESETHWGYSYRVEVDGTVSSKQKFYWFHVPDEADDSGVGGWVMDRKGYLYAATRMGVQVFDHNGRSRAILPVPAGEIVSIAFGGPDMTTLFVGTTDRKFYRRKMKIPGLAPGAGPIDVPGLGAG
jgi:enterochelin esterase-like enzyme